MLEYEKEIIKELPEEALSKVIGGQGIAIKPLLGLGIMTLSMFGGMGAESFAAGESGKGKAVQQQQVSTINDENDDDEMDVDAESVIKNIELSEGYFFAHDKNGNYFVCKEDSGGVLLSYFSPTETEIENLEVPLEVKKQNGEIVPVNGIFNDEKQDRRDNWYSESGAPSDNIVIPQNLSVAPQVQRILNLKILVP